MAEQSHEQLLSQIQSLRTQVQTLAADAYLAAIVESSDDAILAKTLEGIILTWNSGAERLYGYSADEMIGQSILTILPADRVDEITHIQQRIAGGERVEPFDTRRVRKDGEIIRVSLRVSPIFDRDQNVVAASAIARDISGRRQSPGTTDEIDVAGAEQERLLDSLNDMNSQLAQSQQQLARISAELETLAYAISHDLRAPLRAIRGFAEILSRRERNSLNEQAQHYLDNIVDAGAQMDELIEGLLTYARLGRRGVDCVGVSLNEVFRRLVRDHIPSFEVNNATVNIPDDLPVVLGDTTLLYQVFGNILLNGAVYHRPDVSPRIDIDWYPSGKRVIVSVRDNGIGIASEFHEKIFDLFQRLHTQEQFHGTGIGLSIVKKAIDVLDGRIWLESVVNSGTMFFVELPTVSDQNEDES